MTKGGVKLLSVRVNAVAPGSINNPMGATVGPAMFESGLLNEKSAPQVFRYMQPIGRTGEPIEIAKANLFLASDDASFATGAELIVDGG